jgi:hypothetical protein
MHQKYRPVDLESSRYNGRLYNSIHQPTRNETRIKYRIKNNNYTCKTIVGIDLNNFTAGHASLQVRHI